MNHYAHSIYKLRFFFQRKWKRKWFASQHDYYLGFFLFQIVEPNGTSNWNSSGPTKRNQKTNSKNHLQSIKINQAQDLTSVWMKLIKFLLGSTHHTIFLVVR